MRYRVKLLNLFTKNPDCNELLPTELLHSQTFTIISSQPKAIIDSDDREILAEAPVPSTSAKLYNIPHKDDMEFPPPAAPPTDKISIPTLGIALPQYFQSTRNGLPFGDTSCPNALTISSIRLHTLEPILEDIELDHETICDDEDIIGKLIATLSLDNPTTYENLLGDLLVPDL